MKTQKIIVAVLALLSISGFKAYAQKVENSNTNPVHQISLHVSEQNNVLFYADNLEKERSNYILKVYSDEGEMVYASTYFKKGAISKSFDMTELPQGEYKFIVYNKLKPVFSKEVVKKSNSSTDFDNEPLIVELRAKNRE